MNSINLAMNKNQKLIALTLFAILIGACSIGPNTKPSQYYVLEANIEQSNNNLLNDLALGVGPISIPGYINRPQIVTKTDTPELKIEEYSRWAEPIDRMFSRALAENIQKLTNSQQIHSHPWSNATEFKYRLSAKVIKFENDMKGDALLVVHWGIIDTNNPSASISKHTVYKVSATDKEISGRVNALNETIAQFARDIVKTLEDL
jgi:uncharacterized lipoprotein YmbA